MNDPVQASQGITAAQRRDAELAQLAAVEADQRAEARRTAHLQPPTLNMALLEIRMRGYRRGETGAMSSRLSDCAAVDVPRLVAAVEAVLALTRDTDGNDLPPESAIPVGEFPAAISRALLDTGFGTKRKETP